MHLQPSMLLPFSLEDQLADYDEALRDDDFLDAIGCPSGVTHYFFEVRRSLLLPSRLLVADATGQLSLISIQTDMPD